MTCASAAAKAMADEARAAGVVVTVEPEEFLKVLATSQEPLVVFAESGFWSKAATYLTSYKGLAFVTKSEAPLDVPPKAVVIRAKKISIPA